MTTTTSSSSLYEEFHVCLFVCSHCTCACGSADVVVAGTGPGQLQHQDQNFAPHFERSLGKIQEKAALQSLFT